MWVWTVFICIKLLFLSVSYAEEDVENEDNGNHFLVYVKGLGHIRGSTNTSLWSQRTIYQFQGIPFAQPPLGPLRFKPPKPPKPWPGVLEATDFQRKCPQLGQTDEEINELKVAPDNAEDCLYLNVYTPLLPGKCEQQLPVLFYIHGGSFRLGSAHDFRPNHLLEKDVILVVIQYRLGPLGFLSLDSDEIAGNMGLLDQLMALEWVNKHILQFCGDPERVTLTGQSSGAAAVTLMLTSPMTSTYLFQRAIIQSGSTLCNWAVDYSPRKHALEIAHRAQCVNATDSDTLKCLQSLRAYDILNAHVQYLIEALVDDGNAVSGNNGGNHAVIQNAGRLRFMTEDPRELWRNGSFHRVPVMIGVTKHEGSFYVGNIYDYVLDRMNTSKSTQLLRNDFLQSALKFNGIEDETGVITDIFETTFFKSHELGNFTKMVNGLVDMCGATLVKGCTFKTARLISKATDTYLYSFHYKGSLTKFGSEEYEPYPFPGGVAHSDDLIYLFPFDKGTLNEEDKKIAHTLVELWTHFAAYGTPAPTSEVEHWPKMSTDYGPYLQIDLRPEVKRNFLNEYYIAARENFFSGSKQNTVSLLVFSVCFLSVWLR